MIKRENYINIQGWMLTDLHLSGNELLVYAIIYGYSQDNESKFEGSIKYLIEWTNSSKQTIINTLKSLINKGLIEKEEYYKNKIKFCRYFTTSTESLPGVVQNFYRGGTKSLPNNIDNNIEYNINIKYNPINDNIDEFWQTYKVYCSNLPQIKELSMMRRQKIKQRLKNAPIETWQEVFKKINDSAFCCGNNDRKWKANFDWIVANDTNYLKVLEGKYDNKDIKQEISYEEAKKNWNPYA